MFPHPPIHRAHVTRGSARPDNPPFELNFTLHGRNTAFVTHNLSSRRAHQALSGPWHPPPRAAIPLAASPLRLALLLQKSIPYCAMPCATQFRRKNTNSFTSI